jgi:guanylate kinase
LKETGQSFHHVTTVTTRARRPRERDDVDYHFVSPDRFQEMLRNAELLEWARVYENWYGVPRIPVKEALAAGQDVVIKVDIQGASTIKKAVPGAILIFLMPSSPEDLNRRLAGRRTESPDDLARRVEIADAEMQGAAAFDYAVVNREGEIDRAVAQIQAIITAERCRVHHPEIIL